MIECGSTTLWKMCWVRSGKPEMAITSDAGARSRNAKFSLAIFEKRWIMRAMDATAQRNFYSHSGKAPAGGLVLAIAIGAVVASLLALVYAYFDAVMPFVYFNIVAAGGLGMVSGVITGKLLVRGRVRNNRVAALAGLAVGVVALYVAWAAWPHALFDRFQWDIRFAHLLTSPSSLWSTIVAINQQGAWRISNSTPKGLFLWVAWSAEALFIIGMAMMCARGSVASEPFCESCQNWCAFEKRVLETHGWDPEEMKKHLESRDFAYLASLGPRTRNDVTFFRINLHRCRGCGKTATLTAEFIDLVEEKGNLVQKAETVVEGLLVTGDDLERLRTIAAQSPP